VTRAPLMPVAVLLDRSLPTPLPLQLAGQIRSLILEGVLRPGGRLPSTRALARELAVARGVVEQGFDQLTAEGWLAARPGAGTFVAAGAGSRYRRGEPVAGTSARRAAGSLTAAISLSAGTPWVDPGQEAGWRRAWRSVGASRPPRSYPDPAGLPELRDAIAEHVGRHRGLSCSQDEVLIVSGTTHGLSLLLGVIGDGAVALEDPGYRAAAATVRASGRDLVDVPVDAEGVDVSFLARVPDDVRAVYVSPAHQHPLGMTMSGPRRFSLLEEARRRDCLVIEDDYDSEFRYDVAPLPAMAPLDRERVVYLGTVSKTVSPGLRLGWLVTSAHRVEQMSRAREARHDHPSWPVQVAVRSMLEEGHVDRLVRSARRVYSRRSELVLRRLSGFGEMVPGAAGMYLTLALPPSAAVAVTADALRQGVDVPRLRDYCRTATRDGLVIGFGGPSDDELDIALKVLERSLRSRT
jgi:GntR family transcriptional regulator / MocR family aminotransferase